ncbi:MAG: flagellar biosynthetic protein FliO, partial [Alphaproteobacteria bacterium]|nr:flagellar biosynthetic protein FliO [Alphaproteobacteria bacterium]
MLEWIEGLAGPAFVGAVLWTFAALILLVIVLVIVKLIRSMTFGTFVAGGRNRKTRLAVMDATAVDSHRRLVLVRRDDVEHLILIGGPTDVVVEREIRYGQSPRRSA